MVPKSPVLEQSSTHERKEPEEGSPEYIRRRFFPNAQKDDPNLAWMDISPTSPSSDASSSKLRFDLHANPIPPSVSLSLPTYLGLHHHAEGTHAGYTLDDIFLLSRSTVPAQRATMLGVLAGIGCRLAKLKTSKIEGMEELVGKEEELRKRILAAGLEAISERGSVGAHAIEVIWECIVGWDLNVTIVEGVELDPLSRASIDILPLEYVLPQITTILTQGSASPKSSTQLLSVLHRLAQQSNAIATSIVSTPKLCRTIMQVFLLTPMSSESTSHLPDSLAIQLFHTLALSSRQNAQEIEKHVDCLLQYISFLPSTSPYPSSITIRLLVAALRLYANLASYGLHCHIPGTAVTQFAQLEQYVISEACTSHSLVIAWANLVEIWTICAIDPHQTTPDHDILWSQIVGWGWNTGIVELTARFGTVMEDRSIWTALWRAQASWLEGSKVNGVKGGEVERLEFLSSVKERFGNGKEGIIVTDVLTTFWQELGKYEHGNLEQLKNMSSYAALLTAVIRLWLACIAPHTGGGVPSTPPFYLPFARISELCANLSAHPVWSLLSSSDSAFGYLDCREFSGLLSRYLQLSRRLPDVSEDLWMAQAFTILLRLGPGDEDFALAVMEDLANRLTPEWAAAREIIVPPILWETGVIPILQPFITNMLRPHADVIIGPITPTTQSIKSATTQRLPSRSALEKVGLPLNRDWALTPLDHLLRSGDSPVFKALPTSWNASEVEITRASLFLTKVIQESLRGFSLRDSILSREEAVFGCMKVFMLEHGQSLNDSAEEIFRDGIVERFMGDILRPYVYGGSTQAVTSTRHEDLEKVAARFLGASVPFYQYYTDFVALYDAISFSHPLIGRLLLPPISMRYALDYRKHLWCDFNHLVKTIRVLPEQVLSGDIREYLYPIETDPQILGSYLSSLLQGRLQDFMRWIALHHVAANIWSDLQENEEVVNEERASTFFKAVVVRGDDEVVREVVRYRQPSLKSTTDPLLLPPSCFEPHSSEMVVNSRLGFIMRWMGQNMVDRLKGLLTAA